VAAVSYKGVVKNNRVVLQRGINLPDGLEVEVIPLSKTVAQSQGDWLEQARHVRELIASQIQVYAGDSVKEIRELREDRLKTFEE
jgi:hypothetical protein